jgi:hypothetical protein
MRSQVAKNQIDAIVQKIKVMRENEEILVGVHGKKEYDRMIAALVIKCPESNRLFLVSNLHW